MFRQCGGDDDDDDDDDDDEDDIAAFSVDMDGVSVDMMQ
jgi:hypothetical protein